MKNKLYQLSSIATLFWMAGFVAVAAPYASAVPDSGGRSQRVPRLISAAATNADDTDESDTDESELILVPGTGVSLLPPAGFVLSDQFSGLVNPDTLSSILIIELPPEAYSTLASTFSSTPEDITAAFARQGTLIEVERVSTISIGETQVPLVIGTQTAGSQQVKKYFTLLGEERTILLSFNVLDSSFLDEEKIAETIQSVNIASVPSLPEKVAELPFTFEVAEPFQIAEVLVGTSVLLNLDGELVSSEEEPLVVIGSSVSPMQATDLIALSLEQTVEFAGGEGYFTQALISDAVTLQYLRYVRVLPNRFYIEMVVWGEPEIIEELTPAIEAIRNSIRVNETLSQSDLP